MCGLTNEELENYQKSGIEIEKLKECLEREKDIIKTLEGHTNMTAAQTQRLYEVKKKAAKYQTELDDKTNVFEIIDKAKSQGHTGKIIVNKTTYPPTEITIGKFSKLFNTEKLVNAKYMVKGGEITVSQN